MTVRVHSNGHRKGARRGRARGCRAVLPAAPLSSGRTQGRSQPRGTGQAVTAPELRRPATGRKGWPLRVQTLLRTHSKSQSFHGRGRKARNSESVAGRSPTATTAAASPREARRGARSARCCSRGQPSRNRPGAGASGSPSTRPSGLSGPGHGSSVVRRPWDRVCQMQWVAGARTLRHKPCSPTVPSTSIGASAPPQAIRCSMLIGAPVPGARKAGDRWPEGMSHLQLLGFVST